MQRSKSRKSDVYRVERLVAKRIRSNRVEYLVKWKNWSEAHNSWEPEKNILDKRLIESFLRRDKRKRPKDVDSSITSLDTTQSSTETSISTPASPLPTFKQPLIESVTTTNNTTTSTAGTNDAIVTISQSNLHPIKVNCDTTSTSTTTTTGILSINSRTPSPSIPSENEQKHAGATVSTTTTTTTTTSWSEAPISPSPSITTMSTWDSFFDRNPDRRFRQSTMIAAAASASLASFRKTARLMCSSSSFGSIGSPAHHPRSATPNIPDSSPQHQRFGADTDPAADERPKIRITIPRDILLSCPPAGASSSTSSTISRDSSQISANSSASTDELERSSVLEGNSSTMETEDPSAVVPPRFLAPVEVPRRSAPSNSASSPVSIVNLRISEPTILADQTQNYPQSDGLSPTIGGSRSLPKWFTSRTSKDTSPPTTTSIVVPKFVLLNSLEANHHHHHHQKRRYSEEVGSKQDNNNDGHHNILLGDTLGVKRRKHSDRKEKRRRKRMQDNVRGFLSDADSASPFDVSPIGYSGPTKIRRRSGSSNSHASTMSSSDGLSPTPSLPTPTLSEDTPRVAPLRIQLRSLPTPIITGNRITAFPDSQISSSCSSSPKSSLTSPFSTIHPNRLRDRSNRSAVPQPRVTLLTPDPKRLRLVQEICVTDVTVGGLTISIKECSGPDDFFGVPSSQLVQWVTPKNLNGPVIQTTTSTQVKPELKSDLASSQSHPQDSVERPYHDENMAPSDLPADTLKIRMSQPLSPTRPMCNLSTIFEESTLESSKSSKRSEDVSLAGLSGSQSSPQRIQSIDEVKPLHSSMPEEPVGHSSCTHSDAPSTSALMLAATEAVLKSTDEPPSSPGLLTPPRRASTPVSRIASLSKVESQVPDIPKPISTTSASTVVSTCSFNSTVSVSAITSKSSSSTSTVNNSVARPKNVPLKPSTFSSPISVKINPTPRPRVMSQKGTTSGTPVDNNQRRSKSRDPPSNSTTRAPRLITKPVVTPNRSLTVCSHDPVSVYTFSDSSPTHHLSPRTRPTSRPPETGGTPPVSSSSCTFVRKPSSSTPADMLRLMDTTNISVAPLMLPCSQMSTFSPLLGLQPSHGCMNIPGPQTSLAMTLPTLNGQSPVVSNSPDSAALATAIYMQQLRMQFLANDNTTSNSMCTSSSNGLPMLNSISSASTSTVTPWASIQLPNNLTNAFSSLLPNSSLMGNDSLFGSTFQMPTGPSPGPSLSSAPNSSMLVSSGTNLMLPTQLQLADMVAAAVNQSAVFNTSSSHELYSSTDHRQYPHQYHAASASQPFLADETPMDLSAKR